MPEPNLIDIVIADDHAIFVDALCAVFAGEDRLRVVATTTNGDALLKLLRDHRPDVAIIDVSMPGPGAEAIASSAARDVPEIRLIALTMHNELGLAETLLASGIAGYVVKDSAFDELRGAIDTVLSGQRFMSAALSDIRNPSAGPLADLTPREAECLRATAQGLSNKNIAAHLQITERTVKFHLQNIFQKIGASNRAEAIAVARRYGFI
ncbi:MAG: response regulator transcription factor [Pseudomonadota bacterium]